MCSGPQDG
jgi:hypothetical protein